MDFYGLKTCDTCRKAEKALRSHGYDLNVIDVRSDGVPKAELERFVETFGEPVVNRRSTTWRGLSDAEQAGNPVELLANHPTLMKRPVIGHEGRLYLGWGKDVQDALLG
ncbi:ArsC/Spx/MgsR family protein [Psychromarinibacter sp. S121]|uniref:ArsC/Spx/MgsR family protein n=1 Tax=Psychromarinibacter sp. S121 TaxID=3415127 RepID=UPI003C7BA69E